MIAPTLAQVPAGTREGRKTGWFVFFGGICRGWRHELRAGEWQQGAQAVAADGSPGVQVATGEPGAAFNRSARWEARA